MLAIGIALEISALPMTLAVNRVIEDYLNPVGLILALVGLIWVATGAVVVSRQPRNWAGWLFSFIGLALSFSSFIQAYALYGLLVSPGSLPLTGLAAWLNEYVVLAVAFTPLLFLLFPDGRVPGPRWRWAVIGLLGGMGLAFLGSFVRAEAFNNIRDWVAYENPFGIEALGRIPGTVIALGTVVAMVSSVACVFGLRTRFRRSSGEQRQQMRWLVFVGTLAAGLFAVTFLFGLTSEVAGIDGAGKVPIFPILLAMTATTVAFGVPAAFLIAIFRYRLYDLDIVIRKTVVVAAMAVFIGAVYAAIVGGVGTLIGSRGGPVLSFLAAAVLAIAFQPARDRARRLADRVVYGKRATPYEVLAEFSERVGETYASDDVLERMATVLAEGTGAETATVWLRLGNTHRPEATHPAGAEPPGVLPADAVEVRHQGEALGALSIRMPANDPMDPAKQQLIGDLAAQAGLVLRNVRLVEELRESRRRIVRAQDEERRKIERNIHDGVQQHLVALQVQLRLARTTMERDPSKAGEMLDALQGVSAEALEDLRDLARGIYPPLLADKGLAAALESQGRKAALPVTVSPDGIGRYPEEVEATVYFCVLEALNNVAKYAEATSAIVALSSTDGHLRFVVSDDGRGFDPRATGYGTGLQGMADRLDAIGGRLTVTSAPGEGTTISGWVRT
jgi:signal transduction histidine kinase